MVQGKVPVGSVPDPDTGPLASVAEETEGRPLAFHEFLPV